MEWSTAITIILGSSVLGAALNNFVGWNQKKSDRTTQATFIALNLAHLFEQYSYACLSAAEHHDTAESSGGYAGTYIKDIPPFPDLPDYEYQVFDLGILDTVFDFPHQVSFAVEGFSFMFEVLDGEDALKEGYKRCLTLARQSLLVADSIRQRYNLKPRSMSFGDYSARKRITEKLAAVSK